MKRLRSLILPVCILATGSIATAYPEFQKFVADETKRPVNCAMCHAHSDGPEGTAPGQIGKLTAAELDSLGRARAALLPGQEVNSPILNAFGNHIIKSMGKSKFVELKNAPAHLADLLPQDSDLDKDGIPDAREYLEGTHPLIRHDGNPWLLFKHNFQENLTIIVLTLLATISGILGLRHLLRGFAVATARDDEDADG